MPDELKELNEKIAQFESLLEKGEEEPPKLKKLKTQRDVLLAKSGSSAPGEDAFDLGVDEEELAEVKSGFSNRPSVGEYAAEIGIPEINYSVTAMKIPVTITEEGQFKGFDGDAFYPGKSKDALFSIKNICESAGVKAQKNPKTDKMFYPIMQLAGKKITAVYKLKAGKPWVGNDGLEREGIPQSKLAHAKPYYEKPKTII